jgi:hypothetical protein
MEWERVPEQIAPEHIIDGIPYQHGVLMISEKEAGVLGGHRILSRYFLGEKNGVAADLGAVQFRVDVSGKYNGEVLAEKNFMMNNREDVKDLGAGFQMVSLFALSLLHCKNVNAEKSLPADARLQASRARRGKSPLFRFHTIKVGGVPSMPGHGRNGPHEAPAFHICRGHFKKFDERPLFGKFRGTYWWPTYARGDEKKGVVEKDYEAVVEAKDAD